MQEHNGASPAPIRVLWLIKGLGPGGAEQLLLLSAGVADRSRFDYRIVFLRPDKTHLLGEFEALGIVPERIGGSRRIPDWPLRLRQILREVDVVHPHSPVVGSVARLLAITLPRSERPAVVYTEHNEWTSHRLPTRLLNALTARLDHHHWAVSRQVKDTIWPSLRGSYEVLIHGIDTRNVAPADGARERVRAELGIAPDQVLAVTVANLRKNKDYPNLLAAALRATEVEPRLRFAAVGQGPLEEELTALHAELRLGERLRFLGFRRDIHDILAAADLFVLGSAHEGLPVAMMEAFAAGLPVVATAVGGLPDAVTEGVHGRLVPPHDSAALADAVVGLVRDPELRARMAAAVRERSADYDIRTAVAEQERTYAELAGRRVAGRGSWGRHK